MVRDNIDYVIKETVDSYLSRNLIFEKRKKKKNNKDSKKNDDDEKDTKAFKKKAIKARGGLRKDFDVYDDKTYNKNVNDMEQSDIKKLLKGGYMNVKKVAERLYPDHTPEGAQSQLNKKLNGDLSDSGSRYKLKTKELRRLRAILTNVL